MEIVNRMTDKHFKETIERCGCNVCGDEYASTCRLRKCACCEPAQSDEQFIAATAAASLA